MVNVSRLNGKFPVQCHSRQSSCSLSAVIFLTLFRHLNDATLFQRYGKDARVRMMVHTEFVLPTHKVFTRDVSNNEAK